VPIYNSRDEVYGSITLISNKKGKFDDLNLTFLQNISEQVSCVIENILLKRQQNIIALITQTLLEDSLDWDKVVYELCKIFESDGCTIFFKKEIEGHDVLALKATTGLIGIKDDDFDYVFYEFSEGLTGYIAKEIQFLNIINLLDDEELSNKTPGLNREWPKFREDSIFRRDFAKSFMGCCLHAGKDVCGVIRIIKNDPDQYYTTYDEYAFRYVADLLTLRYKIESIEVDRLEIMEYKFLNEQRSNLAHDARSTYANLYGYLRTIYDTIPQNKREDQATKIFLEETQRLAELNKLYINEGSGSLSQHLFFNIPS